MSHTFECLKGGIINEFCLLNNLEIEFRAIFSSLGDFTPIEEMIVVHNSARKVSLEKIQHFPISFIGFNPDGK